MKHIIIKLFFILLAVYVRIYLFSNGWNDTFGDRVELVTPISSFERINEGLFLKELNLSPYEGSIYHQPPLILFLFDTIKEGNYYLENKYVEMNEMIEKLLPNENDNNKIILEQLKIFIKQTQLSLEEWFFIFSDLFVSYALYKISAIYFKNEESLTDLKTPPDNLSSLIGIGFLLIPYSIISCVAKTTSIISCGFTIYALYFAIKGNLIMGSLCLSICSYLSLYNVQLILPFILIFKKYHSRGFISVSFFYLSFLANLMLFSTIYLLMIQPDFVNDNNDLMNGIAQSFNRAIEFNWSDWDWIKSTYYFVMNFEDLTPNIGLFWYFFQEVFVHFRPFFCFVFQLHCFVYLLPLSIRFKHRPIFLFWTIIAIIATFQPYTSTIEVFIEIILMTMFTPIILDLHFRGVILYQIFVYLSILMPLFWKAWIYQGSGNANFFYGTTLVLSIGQVWIISEGLRFMLERDYLRKLETKQKKLL
eukprot:TRINITY_DN2064_c0_g3_i1.p1 TRINITY_DN2064_c0_g3~~TRINITY_DN2064_c0_g3_i1.p1  ORF type:complete len:490 (+),score=84.21 TRINITY_DN2064_c0_g3_i1:43-1470(+)